MTSDTSVKANAGSKMLNIDKSAKQSETRKATPVPNNVMEISMARKEYLKKYGTAQAEPTQLSPA